ncbi:hypothetical protein IGJ48_002419 [Enterococcus pernyi]
MQDWLKWSVEDQGNSSLDAIYLLRLGEAIDSVSLSYMALTKTDPAEVLAVLSNGLWNRSKRGEKNTYRYRDVLV